MMMTTSRFISIATVIVLLGASSYGGEEVKVELFGLEIGKPLPEKMESQLADKVLKAVPKPNDNWDSYFVMVRPWDDNIVEFISARKTFRTTAAGSKAHDELLKLLVAQYGVTSGTRFRANGGTCVYTLSFVRSAKRLTYRMNWSKPDAEGPEPKGSDEFDAGEAVGGKAKPKPDAPDKKGLKEQTLDGHRYRVVIAKVSWEEARAKCKEAGGHLVTIDSTKEMLLVRGMAHETHYLWLGGHKVEDKWTWVDGTKWAVTDWARDTDPSHADVGCVGLRSIKKGKRWTASKSPHSAFGGFICEWDE